MPSTLPLLLALAGATGCCLEVTGEEGGGSGTQGGTGTGTSGTSRGPQSGTSTGSHGATSTGSQTGTGTGAACAGDNRWIYVVDGNNQMLARFDPASLTFNNLGTLNCPSTPNDSPWSMAVDRNGIAWLSFRSGALFQANTRDATCSATDYVASEIVEPWGMSFLTQTGGEPGSSEALYIDAWNGFSTSELGVLQMPALVLDPVASVAIGSAELAEANGELWAFSEAIGDSPSVGSQLSQLDPSTGSILQSVSFPDILINQDFAMKFWRDSFWIFIGASVYQVPYDTLVPTLVVSDDGYDVIGAGASNCGSQ